MIKKSLIVVYILLLISLVYFIPFRTIFGDSLNPIMKNSPNLIYGVAVGEEPTPYKVNLVSGPWVGSSWNKQNEDWLLQFRDYSRANQIPYINMYVIAGLGSAKEGLKDCNVGGDKQKTLCVTGANFIRNNKQNLFEAYKETATKIKDNYGTQKPILLHFEPDFSQYGDYTQANSPVEQAELTEMMNSWTDLYKKILPNAKLVMDVSPWTQDLKSWSSLFRNFDYVGIVGRRFPPQGNPILNENSYKQIVELTGKKLIINDAHGPGGKWLPYNKDWEDEELVKARFADGVVAVIEPPTDLESLTKVALKNQQSTSD